MPALKVSSENESRASIYWWLATVFTRELEPQQLEAYRQGEGTDLLRELGQVPELSSAVKQINSGLAKSLVLEDPQLELSADFCQLFLSDMKTGAPPYASVYLSDGNLLFQKPHQDMLDRLKKAGMQVDPEFKEPADHIAIQLDYLGNLIMRDGDSTAEQKLFIEQQLLTWVPSWLDAVQRVSNCGFYQGFAELLLAYLKLDLQAL